MICATTFTGFRPLGTPPWELQIQSLKQENKNMHWNYFILILLLFLSVSFSNWHPGFWAFAGTLHEHHEEEHFPVWRPAGGTVWLQCWFETLEHVIFSISSISVALKQNTVTAHYTGLTSPWSKCKIRSSVFCSVKQTKKSTVPPDRTWLNLTKLHQFLGCVLIQCHCFLLYTWFWTVPNNSTKIKLDL